MDNLELTIFMNLQYIIKKVSYEIREKQNQRQ